ncbi:TonB-dependent receptor [uncultured Sphingomonas sp.]|uniref:TonB-dependent receptor n=1 Tax=uncultured Sphingomonas sp. TaxID=158754 RepID=UPI0035C9CCD9
MPLARPLLLLAGCAAPLAAQTAPPPTAPPPDDIVVTGRGLADAPADRAFGVVVIDRARLEENAARRLESVLGEVAGLQQFRRSDSRSANPTAQGITLRGIGGNASSRALLILDGVPQADPFGGWIAFPAYATGRLGRIKVTRGGGSGYWGPGALAGTVELESATPGELGGLDGAVSYGSRDSLEAQGAATLERGGGFATLSGAYGRGDGFTPIVRAARGSVDRPAAYEQASGAIRAAVEVAPATELQANVTAFDDRRERGTPFTDNRSRGADASVRLVGHGRWGFSALAYVQTRDFRSSFAAIDAARTTATRTLDQYSTPATGIGGRIEIAPPLGRTLSLRVGVDLRGLEGESQELATFVAGAPTRRRVAGGRTRTAGLFADGSVEAGAFTLALGGRVDRWTITRGRLVERTLATGVGVTDLRFPDRDGTEATGRAGLAWRVDDAATVRAAAYRGWRLPTLNELYRPFRVGADANGPNAALGPEQLSGVEGGATLTPLPGLSIGATVFHNRLADAIANVTAGAGPGQFPLVGFVGANGVYRIRRNLDAVRSTGLEVDAAWQLGPVATRLSWSRVDARVDASGAAAALDGLRPAQTPRDQIAGSVSWRAGDRAASLTLRHAGGQWDDDANTRRLAPATTLDAYAAWPLTARLAVEARAENLADERIEAAITGADLIERATPRTLWIGLRLR